MSHLLTPLVIFTIKWTLTLSNAALRCNDDACLIFFSKRLPHDKTQYLYQLFTKQSHCCYIYRLNLQTCHQHVKVSIRCFHMFTFSAAFPTKNLIFIRFRIQTFYALIHMILNCEEKKCNRTGHYQEKGRFSYFLISKKSRNHKLLALCQFTKQLQNKP